MYLVRRIILILHNLIKVINYLILNVYRSPYWVLFLDNWHGRNYRAGSDSSKQYMHLTYPNSSSCHMAHREDMETYQYHVSSHLCALFGCITMPTKASSYHVNQLPKYCCSLWQQQFGIVIPCSVIKNSYIRAIAMCNHKFINYWHSVSKSKLYWFIKYNQSKLWKPRNAINICAVLMVTS